MGKQGKSSASSATRKKHARKAAAHDPSIAIVPAPKAQGKGKGKGKNKEPRVKQYIPPPKYKPLVEDPIESSAIASALPPSMVLCFKGLSKKDPVTKTKALDELGTMLGDESWSAALPVWLWHFISLSVHPNRRIRELNANIHSRLLEQPGIRDEVQSYALREPNAGTFLAAWALGANDVVPSIANMLKASWSSNLAWHINVPEGQLIEIQDHVDDLVSTLIQAIVDPEQLCGQFAPLLALSSKEGTSADDTGEYSQDRDARIRTAGLNSVTWILEGPLTIAHSSLLSSLCAMLSSNPLVGTILSARSPVVNSDTETDVVLWGREQRGVRMAGWKLVKALVKYLQTHPSETEKELGEDSPPPLKLGLLRNLGISAIRSAWAETDATVRSSMWDGFLPLIIAFPSVWDAEPIDQASVETRGQGRVDSDDDSLEDDTTEMTTDKATGSRSTTTHGHLAFSDFLQFLELGCQGSAIQSYPAISIVLSTIPESIFSYDLNGLERLFASFWAAYDGKALNVLPRDREATFKAFLSSLLDCVVFIFRKLNTLSTRSPETRGTSVMKSGGELELAPLKWIAYVLQELIHGDLAQNVTLDAAGELIGNSMRKLEQINSNTTELAWRVTWEPIFLHQPPGRTGDTIKLLSSMRVTVHEGISLDTIDTLLRRKALVNDGKTESFDPAAEQARVLINLWTCLDVGSAPWLVETSDKALSEEVYDRLVRSGNSRGIVRFLNGYLNAPTLSESTCGAIWSRFLSACTRATTFTLLREALDSVEIPALAPDADSTLFEISKAWTTDLAEGRMAHHAELGSIIVHWKLCLHQAQVVEILGVILNTFVANARKLLFNSQNEAEAPVIESTAQVLGLVLIHDGSLALFTWPELDFTDMSAYLLILPIFSEVLTSSTPFSQCEKARNSWSARAPVEQQSAGGARAKEVMHELLVSCSTPLSAREALAVATRSALYLDEKMILLELIPPQADFDRGLGDLNNNPSPLLAENDPLIDLNEREPDSVALLTYDARGFSKYARVGEALAIVLSEDRHLARENLWTFRHLLALQQLCLDFVAAASWPSDVFRTGASAQVQALLDEIAPLVIYLGGSLLVDHTPQWHKNLISRLQKPEPGPMAPRSAEDIVSCYYSVVIGSSPNSLNLRLFRRTMQFALRDAETEILDIWASFAQFIYTQHPRAGEAIGSVIAARGVESSRLDRWRNDIASRIPGVSTSKINQVGIPLLRALNCLAPPPDSGVIFMPQQRAVYLTQALQKWMSSDEELDASTEVLLTVLLNNLLPILQTVRGAHWEFILDILETNLGAGSSIANLHLLLQTLRGVLVVLDLTHTNEQLKEIWIPRQHDIFQGVLQLFLSSGDGTEQSETHDKYYSCLADVIQALPPEQIPPTLFDELLLLVSSENIQVKIAAHYLARNALSQITEQRVLEAAVSVTPVDYEEPDSDESKFELPPTLVERLVPPVSFKNDFDNSQTNLLLAWWLALEFFDNTSLKVKQGYLDQLRKLNLVKTSLLPCVFELLSIGVLGEKAFNLGPWHVDEFYFGLYDKSFVSARSVLAAHIYFKSLKFIPGLLRAWYSECQDRQLSASISTYTKTFFSPVLISQELAQFRSSAASASEALADETFALKVAPSVNEISASYAVDEQEAFEVAIRLPSEYPLRPAEVRDVRGVSGMENRRRAWLFGVQNTTQQGLIYDALVMYKKNVGGHFEGKSECAICYSLISVTDRTLPTKPCRTCKNLFHASCLYKWFNTSHTSSCPLCRSDIF